MAGGGEELRLAEIGLLSLALGDLQRGQDLAPLGDLLLQLLVHHGEGGRALLDPALQRPLRLLERGLDAAAFGDVLHQREEAENRPIVADMGNEGRQAICGYRYTGRRQLDLEGHRLARQRPRDIAFSPLVIIWRQYFGHAPADDAVLTLANPSAIGFVHEAVDLAGIDVGNERRHRVGDQADAPLAVAQRLLDALAPGDVVERQNEAAIRHWIALRLENPAVEPADLELERRAIGRCEPLGE